MDMELTLLQTRVIGCLIEKEKTTPDQYPLSLNALTLACNQKTNRDPVLDLSDAEVQATLDLLSKKHLLREASGYGGRVVKYKHRFCNTEFGELKLSEQELGIICVLFLRGPQTPGELRTRTNRLCSFVDVNEVETVLQGMAERESAALVARLPREPGKREARYAHLFSGEVEADQAPWQPSAPQSHSSRVDEARISALEAEVVELRAELSEVKTMLDELMT